jgi:predicted  nucleic acid-binding Zn-ribbon protein
MQINAFKVELTTTKTKLKQLERENKRQNEEIEEINTYDKTPAHKYIRLTNALRKTIKELKQEGKIKDEEILRMKKHVKISKISEIETEAQVLREECKRLKVIIDETRKKNESPGLIIGDPKTKEINVLKKDKLELENQVKTLIDEIRKVKDKLAEVKSKNKGNDKELNKSLKSEVQKLRSIMESNHKEMVEKETGFKQEIVRLRKIEDELRAKLEK